VFSFDFDALSSFTPLVIEEWLGTSTAQAIARAPDRWTPVRAVRGKVSLHVELQRDTPSPGATLWVATRPGAPLAMEWRQRLHPCDASRARLHVGLEAVHDHLNRIASEARELCDDIGSRKRGPQQLMPPLHHIDVGAEDLGLAIDETIDALKGWDAKLAEPSWPALLDFDVNAPALPADLVAAVPSQQLHFERFLARHLKRGNPLLSHMPRARVVTWRNTSVETEIGFRLPDGSSLRVGAGGDAKRRREGREHASHEERLLGSLDGIQTHARGALFEVEDMLESIDEVDPGGESKPWRARAFRALRETMPVLAGWAYGEADELLESSGLSGAPAGARV
jgi:hypothetical protein